MGWYDAGGNIGTGVVAGVCGRGKTGGEKSLLSGGDTTVQKFSRRLRQKAPGHRETKKTFPASVNTEGSSVKE